VRIDWAIPCRFVEVQQPHGATIVGAGADVVHVATVPAVAQLLFAVRYVGAIDELDGSTPHPIATRIFNPAGDLVGEQSGQLTAHAEMAVEGWVAELIVPSALIVEVRELGTYGIEFAIDEDERRVPIHVIEPRDA
jgi:hypothetical protein